MNRLPEEWMGEVVGRMHIYRIPHNKLAERAGITPAYLSIILNNKKDFQSPFSMQLIKKKIMRALEEMEQECQEKIRQEEQEYAREHD